MKYNAQIIRRPSLNSNASSKDILPNILACIKAEGMPIQQRSEVDPRTYIFTYQNEHYLLSMKGGSSRLTLSKLAIVRTMLPEEIIYQICAETSAREACTKACLLYIQDTATEEKEYTMAFACQFFTTAAMFQTFFFDYLASIKETEKIFNAYYQRISAQFSLQKQYFSFKETSVLQ